MLRRGPKRPALSAHVEFIALMFPSTGPDPCILCLKDFVRVVVIIHACAPFPSFTVPSDAPNNFPFLSAAARCCMLPFSCTGPWMLRSICKFVFGVTVP